MNRYALLDANRVLVSYYSTTDVNQLAANIPPGGSCVLSSDTAKPGTVRYDLGNKPVLLASAIETLPQMKARLSAAIMATAESLKMTVRSPGNGKSGEYRLKKDEAETSGNLLAAALNALTRANAFQQYPGAEMEAQLTGEPRATVLARYRARSSASDIETLRISAVEQDAKRLVNAATSFAAAQAAYDAINWAWKPIVA